MPDSKAPPLSEQTVLITGAANGLGRAIAAAFSRAGSKIVLVDVDGPTLERVAHHLPGATWYVANLADRASTDTMLGAVIEENPHVHTLIHNAGYLKPAPFDEMTWDRWSHTFNVGIQAAYLMTRAFWPDWRRNGGTGIYVSSRSGIQGSAGETPYSATKHAIEGFVQTLGLDGAESGIFAHSVTPGMYMHTPMSEQNYPAELKGKWVDPIQLAAGFLYLAEREDAALSGKRLSAWELAEQFRDRYADLGLEPLSV